MNSVQYHQIDNSTHALTIVLNLNGQEITITTDIQNLGAQLTTITSVHVGNTELVSEPITLFLG